ncbi:MAG: hypothetical protein NTW16_06880 [Bacteroidetes bacterium]|nr:hypothetical protein [Bacteroidota bacterium]
MNEKKKGSSATEMDSTNGKARTKLDNFSSPLMIVFGAILGFTSGHLHHVYGIVLFSISIIALGILLYLYYFKK